MGRSGLTPPYPFRVRLQGEPSSSRGGETRGGEGIPA